MSEPMRESHRLTLVGCAVARHTRVRSLWCCQVAGVNGQVKVPAGGQEKSPPQGAFQGFVDGPPALVLASFIR